MRAIDRIEQLAKAGDKPRVLEVPELAENGTKFLVYAWPLSLLEMDAITVASQQSMARAYAVTLQLRAKNEHGKPLFAEADVDELIRLRGVGMNIVRRLANEINEDMADQLQGNEELKELGED